MTPTYWISSSTPNGNNRRIELSGMDLWISARIDNVFVYPSRINIDRFKVALSQTLFVWPIVAGRILLENDEKYFIEMCDQSLPLTYVINTDLNEWPYDSNVVVEADDKQFATFLDEVQMNKIFDENCSESLVRLKITHLIKSDECILGISWCHLLGDADSCLHFSNTLSRFYQKMEIIESLPIFERFLSTENQVSQPILPIPKQFQNALSIEKAAQISLSYQTNYDRIDLFFSGDQINQLKSLIKETNITSQDALTAYVAMTLNKYCYNSNDERRILHTVTIVNIRGVNDSICCKGQVANCLFMMLSDDFEDSFSLSNIAKTIRRSIIKLRNLKYFQYEINAIDKIMRNNVKNKRSPNPELVPNELAVNSNLRYDWADLVDLGFKDRCRFYTAWTSALYLRVFRLNPVKNGDQWLIRDRNGAQISFRIEKHLKETFLNVYKKDIDENFTSINT